MRSAVGRAVRGVAGAIVVGGLQLRRRELADADSKSIGGLLELGPCSATHRTKGVAMHCCLRSFEVGELEFAPCHAQFSDVS